MDFLTNFEICRHRYVCLQQYHFLWSLWLYIYFIWKNSSTLCRIIFGKIAYISKLNQLCLLVCLLWMEKTPKPDYKCNFIGYRMDMNPKPKNLFFFTLLRDFNFTFDTWTDDAVGLPPLLLCPVGVVARCRQWVLSELLWFLLFRNRNQTLHRQIHRAGNLHARLWLAVAEAMRNGIVRVHFSGF